MFFVRRPFPDPTVLTTADNPESRLYVPEQQNTILKKSKNNLFWYCFFNESPRYNKGVFKFKIK